MTSGVGIRLRDGLIAYFWTSSKQDAVLAALSERGVQVEPGTHGAGAVWSLRDHESHATLPTLPTLLQTLVPVLAFFGAAIMIVLFIVAEFWWMRLIVMVVWAFSLVTTLAPWWKGRRRREV